MTGVLPVAAAAPLRPPATGEEYLALVRKEAREIDRAMAEAMPADDGEEEEAWEEEEDEEEEEEVDEGKSAAASIDAPRRLCAWQQRLLKEVPQMRVAADRVKGVKGSTKADLPPSDDRAAWLQWLNSRMPHLPLLHRLSLTSARQALSAVADALSLGEVCLAKRGGKRGNGHPH